MMWVLQSNAVSEMLTRLRTRTDRISVNFFHLAAEAGVEAGVGVAHRVHQVTIQPKN